MNIKTSQASRTKRACVKKVLVSCIAALMVSAPAGAEKAVKSNVSPEGVLRVPAFGMPPSPLISTEARAALTPYGMAPLYFAVNAECENVSFTFEDFDPELVERVRACWNEVRERPKYERMKEMFDVSIEEFAVDKGTAYHYYDVTPADGIAKKNRERVLINIPGSSSIGKTNIKAKTMAIPISAMGKIRVIGVDYRKGYEYQYPAALKDITALYKDLLKEYRPENIGMYGCSAGSHIIGTMIPWLLQQRLPLPGAVSMGGAAPIRRLEGGDSHWLANALSGYPPQVDPQSLNKVASADISPDSYFARHPYWRSLKRADDPTFSLNDETLKQFPPSLLITSGRDLSWSKVAYLHQQLVKHGADADLHLWEGLPHCFYLNPDIPESHELYNVMVNFFDRNLGTDWVDAGKTMDGNEMELN